MEWKLNWEMVIRKLTGKELLKFVLKSVKNLSTLTYLCKWSNYQQKFRRDCKIASLAFSF